MEINAVIGKNVTIEQGAIIGNTSIDMIDGIMQCQSGKVIIGDNVFIGANTTISRGRSEEEPTIIEDDAIIGPQVLIPHGCRIGKKSIIHGGVRLSGHVTIDKNVRVGAGAVIRNKVNLGEGCMVGVGSVVTKDVPPRVIVIGNPARVYKDRSSENIRKCHG